MKAIRVGAFGEPQVLQLEDLPDPRPAAEQVLVRVCAVGINPVETYIRAGKYGPREFPYTPGNDAAGLVEAVGPGVDRFAVGDRVYTDKTITGSYAELAVCEATGRISWTASVRSRSPPRICWTWDRCRVG